MAITNYGELKAAVENWLTRPDSYVVQRIPEFISLGESMLSTDLRVREMEASETIVTTISQRADPLPTRYVQGRDLYHDTGGRLEYRSPAEFYSVYFGLPDGKPEYYTIIGEDLTWAGIPDAAYSIVFDHYARPAPFVNDMDTNAIIVRWPNLYLYASLIHAMPYIANDPRMASLAALYDSQIEAAHSADARDRYSGDPMVSQRQAGMT